MPPPEIEPSGVRVELLCGQPEQKKGFRAGKATTSLRRPTASRRLNRVAIPTGSSARPAEHTSELPSLMRMSYAVFCLKKQKHNPPHQHPISNPYVTFNKQIQT